MQGQAWYPFVSNSKTAKYAPPISNNQTLAKARKGGRKLNAHPYALKEEDLTPKLRQQLEQLHNFWTSPEIQTRKGRAIKEATFRSYRAHVLSNLGWLHNIQGQKLEQLSLVQVADLDHLQAFINWGIQQKGNSYGWAINIAQVALSVAKWLYSQPQRQDPGDSPQVAALQTYLQTLRKRYHQPSSSFSGNKHLLTPEEGVQLVEYLRQRCAPRDSSGVQRSETALLKSWQRYLIVALLAYSPIRQREIRELEWQRSLFRESDGYWVRFNSGYQTGNKKGVSKAYLLPKHLTPDLDNWIQQWRPKLPTDTQLVFTRLGSNRTPESLGQPLTDRDISDLISTAVYKATSFILDSPTRGTRQEFQHLGLTYVGRISRSELANPIKGPTITAIREVQRVSQQGHLDSTEGTTAATVDSLRSSTIEIKQDTTASRRKRRSSKLET